MAFPPLNQFDDFMHGFSFILHFVSKDDKGLLCVSIILYHTDNLNDITCNYIKPDYIYTVTHVTFMCVIVTQVMV